MAGSAVVGTLRALLTLDTADFEKASVRASKQADKLSKQWGDFGRQASTLGRTLTASLTLPLVGAAAAVTKAGVSFESSFAGVRKTVTATEEQFAELAAGFRNLSKEIPVSVNELNRIGEAAGQLGIDRRHLVDFTAVMAKLGVTTNLSSEEAALSLAKLANVTQMNQADFDRLGSTIVALGNNFATQENAIVDFGQRLAGAGALAKMSEADILAIGTALSSVGVEAEAGGTAAQKVILSMVEAVSQGGEQLERFARAAGMSAAQFREAFEQDAAGAFASFVDGLAAQGNAAIGTLDELGLSDQRLIRSFLSLAGAGDTLREAIALGNTAFEENTALTKEADERFKTTAMRAKLLANQVGDAAIALYDSLRPAIDAAMAAGQRLVPVVEALAKGFAALPSAIQTFTVAGLGLVATVGPATWALGGLASAASTVAGAFSKKGIAARALRGELGSLTTGLSLLRGATLSLGAAVAGIGFQLWIEQTAEAKLGISRLNTELDRLGEKASLWQKLEVIARRLTDPMSSARIAGELLARQFRDVGQAAEDAGEQVETSAERFARQQEMFREGVTDLGASITNMQTSGSSAAEVLDSLGASAALMVDRARQLGVNLDTLPPSVRELAAAFRTAKPAAEGVSTAVGELADRLSGRTLARQLQEIAAAVRAVGGVSGITAYQAEELGRQLAEMRAQGAVLTGDLAELATAFDQQAFTAMALSGNINTLSRSLRHLQMDALRSGQTISEMTAELNKLVISTRKPLQVLPSGHLAPTITSLSAPAAPTSSGLSFDGAALGQAVVQAAAGGGNIGKAVGAQIGHDIGGQISTRVGATLTKTLGQTLGGAVASIIPGVGALLAPLAGKLVGAITSIFTGGEGAKANDLRDSLKADLMAAVKGLENDPGIRAGLEAFGRAGTRKNVQAAFDATMAAVERTNTSMQRYGLTLEDVGSESERFERSLQQLTADYVNLHRAGFNAEQITAGMADQLNNLLSVALETGQQLPATLAPLLEQLVLSGQLTDELAAKLLGVANPVPWREMEEAAERYGISVDQLGKKFDQAKLDEQAQKIADDFKLLAENGGNVGHIMAEMKDEVQELIDKALKLGLTIPESLRPLIEGMVEGGQLVDENGEKLEDLSRLEFAEPLKSQTDELIEKIGELVDALRDGLYPAIENIPDIAPSVDGGGGSGATPSHGNPQYDADGNPLPFSKGGWGEFGKGTPAVLHGTEAVFPLPSGFDLASMLGRVERRLSQSGASQPVQINTRIEVEGREIARASALHLVDEWAAAGVLT